MKFLKKLFVRRPEEYLEKGDGLLSSNSYYEAREAYENGLRACGNNPELGDLAGQLTGRIQDANSGLAALNIAEAEHAITRGIPDKAVEHLELAISLTGDASIREKAEVLLAGLENNSNDTEVLAPSHGCSSCALPTSPQQDFSSPANSSLPPLEYYELLILQLPEELHETYASLGEDFASMYIAASQDNHLEALDLLERWFDGSHRDIYCYEKGKILHRLGRIDEAESLLRDSIRVNAGNPLPHLGLALLLIDEGRLDEAHQQLTGMIEKDIFTGQALLMLGEVYQLGGNHEAAINQYAALIDTPLGRAAAEKLYEILLECGRDADAAHIHKKYLAKNCKH